MGFMDDLKKLTKPYTEDDDDFDEFDDDARPSRPSRSSTAPKPSYSGFDLDNDDLSSSGSSSNTGRRTLGGSNASNGKVVNSHHGPDAGRARQARPVRQRLRHRRASAQQACRGSESGIHE